MMYILITTFIILVLGIWLVQRQSAKECFENGDTNKKNRKKAKSKKKMVKSIKKRKTLDQVAEQQIVLNRARNPEYPTVEAKPYNSVYKLLEKDQVEKKVRQESEKAAGYTHMRPDVKNPYETDGYSYISPALWTVGIYQSKVPICLPQKGQEATVEPSPTTGTPLEALQWQENLPRFTYNTVYDPRYYTPNYSSSF